MMRIGVHETVREAHLALPLGSSALRIRRF